jgi:hypothetical protein
MLLRIWNLAVPSGSTAIVGAEGNDNNGPSSGLEYVFDLVSTCLADVNCAGSATSSDFTAWTTAFTAMVPVCDQNDDGACTPTDFTAWIANINAWC